MTKRIPILAGTLAAAMVAGCEEGRDRDGAPTKPLTTTEFVRLTHPEGFSYTVAKRHAGGDLRELVALLEQPEEARTWANVTAILGASGDARMAGTLIAFLHGGGTADGKLTAGDRERRSALIALGMLAHETGSPAAMEYLLASPEPDIWTERGVAWLPGDEAENERWRIRLSTSALLGLALTGRTAAGEKLREVAGNVELPAELRETAGGTLREWRLVNAAGLSEYYRETNGSWHAGLTPDE